MRDRQLLNVTLCEIFNMVLLSPEERGTGIRITMPSAVGGSIPPVAAVEGTYNTISRSATPLTRADFSIRMQEPEEMDVDTRYHVFLSGHAEMSAQLASVPFCLQLANKPADVLA